MIILYKGARGRGKTLTMVKDAFQFKKDGYNILSNIKLSFGKHINNDDILLLNKDSDINNCVLIIDEIQIFFDSRNSMRKQNISFSNFVQQIRKRNIIVLATTQYSNTIDLRLRQHLDIIAYPNFIKKFNVCEVTYIDLTRLEDNFLIVNEEDKLKPKQIKVVYDARDVFKLYNTNEMIV